MDLQAQKTCNTTTSTTGLAPEVPFIPFLAGLTAWVLLKVSLEFIVHKVNPDFFAHLKTDLRCRNDLYFGTWLGTIFKVVSITVCTASLLTVPASTDIAGLVRPLNTAEQWCWGCRAIIYIQELPHITSIPELVIHHILSVGAMISILAFNIPRRQMYVAWAGLWSEFVSNARRLLKMHGKLGPRLGWWLGTANVLLIVAFRVPGCFVAIVWTLQGGTRGVPLIIDIGCWTIYLVYMLQVSFWEAKKLKLVGVDLKRRPAKITIAEKWDTSLYGIVMGLAFVCTKLSALLVYEISVRPLSSVEELHGIAWGTLQAVLAGLVGGYVVPKGLRSFVLYEKAAGYLGVKRGSMLSGLLFAAAMLLLSPTISDGVDKPALIACVVLSWPLLDAIGYVASYSEGGKLPAKTPEEENDEQPLTHLEEKPAAQPEEQLQVPRQPALLPLQLIGALLSGTIYLSLLTALLTGLINNRYEAAVLAFALRTTLSSSVILPRRRDITLRPTTIYLPLLRDEVDLHKISSLAAIFLSITALFWIDLSEHENSTFTVLGFTCVTDLFTPLKWSALIGLGHVSFELAADFLSRPWVSSRVLRQRGSRRGSKGGGNEAAAAAARRRKRATTNTGRRVLIQTIHNPKFIASAAGLGLVGLVALAVWSDGMPKVITSVEEARGVAVVGSHGGGHGGNYTGNIVSGGSASRLYFLLEVVSSWQFVVSTLGVAVFPVVILQLV